MSGDVKKVEPDLIDLVNLMSKNIFLSLNCHAIATIQKFDGAAQTCQATINYRMTMLEESSSGKITKVLKEYPILVDVPVIQLAGGVAGLDLPITAGDQALIFFNDRDIDNWFAGSSASQVNTPRLHSLSDGIALVGLRTLKNPNSNFVSSRPRLYNGHTGVSIAAEKVKLYNNITTLNTLVASLIDALVAATTTNAVVGAPCALSPATIAALNTIKTNFGGLLE